MRTAIASLFALALIGCDCGGASQPTRCSRVPNLQQSVRELEPYFAHRPVTVKVTLGTNENCPDPSFETWTVEVVDPDNAVVPSSVDATPASHLLVHFTAAAPGAYHTTLSNGFERLQFELPVSRDRLDAGFVDLPLECTDVQVTTSGLVLCQTRDGGYTIWSPDAGALASAASPLTASGDAIWSWDKARAQPVELDGGGLVGLQSTRTDWHLYTAIAPDPDTLHVARNPGNNLGGRLETFRRDGGASSTQFQIPGNATGFGLVAAGDIVFAVSSAPGARDTWACPLPVDAGGATLRFDAGTCLTLNGGTPAGYDEAGVFTRNGSQHMFWRREAERFHLALAAPRLSTVSAPAATAPPHNDWPIEGGTPGKQFDYALALDERAIVYEVYAGNLKLGGADRRIVWGATPGFTRVFFR